MIDKSLDYDYSNVNCDDAKNSIRYGEVLNLIYEYYVEIQTDLTMRTLSIFYNLDTNS